MSAAAETNVPAPAGEELPRVLEALLFVAEEPVTAATLARVLGVGEGAVRKALARLREACQGRGLRLLEDGRGYQLVTAPEYAPYVERFLGGADGPRLSRAALETLTIIAYKQPCTRAEVEAIRGVNCDKLIQALELRGLVAVAGQADAPGKPKLYRTTAKFFEYFGLEGPHELPPLPEEPEPEAENLF